MQNIEQILNTNGQIMAIIISHRFNESGIHFFTPNEFSQQLAYMNHPAGKIIEPHYHNAVQRNVVFTQEVLIIKKGKLKVDFYDDDLNHTESSFRNWRYYIIICWRTWFRSFRRSPND